MGQDLPKNRWRQDRWEGRKADLSRPFWPWSTCSFFKESLVNAQQELEKVRLSKPHIYRSISGHCPPGSLATVWLCSLWKKSLALMAPSRGIRVKTEETNEDLGARGQKITSCYFSNKQAIKAEKMKEEVKTKANPSKPAQLNHIGRSREATTGESPPHLGKLLSQVQSHSEQVFPRAPQLPRSLQSRPMGLSGAEGARQGQGGSLSASISLLLSSTS